MEKYLRINHESEIPKYKQVVDMIISDIDSGILKKGQRIPSINETSEDLLLSRDTVEKAYVFLKNKGILSSVRGKGYFINKTNVYKKMNIALVFNKLSNYKRNIYYSFVSTLGNKASVDVFIYNYDLSQLDEIIDNNILKYDYYVILPHYKNETREIIKIIKKIPREKVLLVDRKLDLLNDYPMVYQEYEKDIQSALNSGINLIKKYIKINLVFPGAQYYSKHIIRGFQIFCQVNGLNFSVIEQIDETAIKRGEAFVIISDDDLYRLIKVCRLKKWKLGKDIGIVAYNENPVKEILEDGITTISTNHDEMGRMAAEMILSRKFGKVKNPFTFIQRNSL